MALPRIRYDDPVVNRLRFAATATLLAATIGAAAYLAWPGPTSAAETVIAAPALSEQLRHIGRDHLTGLPAWVGEGFIAQQEQARDRYGKDEREAIPPPPLEGTDVAAIAVEAIGIEANIDRFGVDRFGRLDVPQDAATVGWHPAYSSLPGSGGATFLAAHYEFGGRPGIFYQLSDLQPGDVINVELSNGTAEFYIVSSAVDYELGVIDMGALLFGREGAESITLMTCSGRFVDGTFDYRTVVLAERLES